MSVQFVESEWITVTVKGVEARLLVREPNAMEGVRYFAAVDKHREAMKTDFEALERIIQTHINLLTACVLDSENFEPAFPRQVPRRSGPRGLVGFRGRMFLVSPLRSRRWVTQKLQPGRMARLRPADNITSEPLLGVS